jgi:hypothetical protein
MRAHTHLGKVTIALAAAAIAVAPTALAYTGEEPSLTAAPATLHLAAAADWRSPDSRDAALTAQQQTAATADRRSPDTRDTSQATQSASVNAVLTAPVDGRSPDTIDAASPAQAPVVTATRSPGFQWGDFGIGAAAALTAMLMLAFTIYLLAARHNRKQPNPVATA